MHKNITYTQILKNIYNNIQIKQRIQKYSNIQISTSKIMQPVTQPNFDNYAKTLKQFYIKVLKNHPMMLKLSRNLIQMIQDISKRDPKQTLSRLNREKSLMSISQYSNKEIKRVKSLRSPTTIISKKQYLFQNQDIKRVLLFAYLHHIITISNHDVFNMIETKSKLLIEATQVQILQNNNINTNTTNNNKNIDKNKWQRCINKWKKIMQLMNYKDKVRWQKMLNNFINILEIYFVQILLRSIVQTSSNLTNLINVFSNILDNFEQIANLFKISIVYQEVDDGIVIRRQQYMASKHQIKISYLKHQNLYIYQDKLDKLLIQKKIQLKQSSKIQPKQDKNFLSVQARPGNTKRLQKSTSQLSQTQSKSNESKSDNQIPATQSLRKRSTLPISLIRKKNQRVIESLLKQYNNNTNKILDLQCFQNQDNKEAKIKRMLQSRKKLQQN